MLRTPRRVRETVPEGAEEVIQPLLKSCPMKDIGAVGELERAVAVGAFPAVAAAEATLAEEAPEADEAVAAADAVEVLAAREVARAEGAAPALGALILPPEGEPMNGMERHPPMPRARRAMTAIMTNAERMKSPCAAL